MLGSVQSQDYSTRFFNNFKDLGQAQDKVTVHIVAHSHQDAGWIATIEDYFNNDVSIIYTNVVNVLLRDPTKKFTHAEIMFFSKWWVLQSEDLKAKFRELVKEGRWEFVNGGWVASDEACPTFQDMMQNIIVGHQFLWREFQVVPKIAWHADAFGHSKSTAQLFKNMGYKGMFFARISDDDKNLRINQQNMEFIWQPTFEATDGTQVSAEEGIYAHVMFRHYNTPCNIQVQGYDNKAQISYLYQNQLQQFNSNPQSLISCLKQSHHAYKTNNFLWLLGEDFSFLYAKETYDFMDQIMKLVHMNSQNYEMKYSTVSDYVDSVLSEAENKKTKLQVYQGDFFPVYEIWKDVHWNGYYTSRPNFKKFIRDLSSLAFTSSTLYALEWFKNPITIQSKLANLQKTSQNMLEAISLAMHHDTITGTSQQKIINDQNLRFSKAITENSVVLTQQIEEIASLLGLELSLRVCQANLNERPLCPSPNDLPYNLNQDYIFAVYNPTLQTLNHTQFTFSHADISVSVWNSEKKSFEQTNKVEGFCYANADAQNECDIIIKEQIAILSLKIFKLSYKINAQIQVGGVIDKSISNEKIELSITSQSDQIITFQYRDLATQEKHLFQFNFMMYKSFQGRSYQNSGPYIFKSDLDHSLQYDHTITNLYTQQGNNLQQFVIHYQDKAKMDSILKIRLFPQSDQVEFDVFFARIPNGAQGYDVTANWKSLDINQGGVFYTDSNGMGMVQRKIDPKQISHPYIRPSANYYPINAAVMIEDTLKQKQMIVMNDRPQGGSAYDNNRIELMFNRRGYSNDDMGMKEPINEVDSHGQGLNVSAKFYLKFTQSRDEAFDSIYKQQSLTLNQPIKLYGGSYDRVTQTQGFSQIILSNELLQSLQKMIQINSIYDLSLQMQQDQSLFLRIISASDVNIKLEDVELLVENLCQLQNIQVQEYCNGASRKQFIVKEISLDGADDLDEGKASKRNFGGTVNVQLYRVNRANQDIQKTPSGWN